jgi:hypothetical protein
VYSGFNFYRVTDGFLKYSVILITFSVLMLIKALEGGQHSLVTIRNELPVSLKMHTTGCTSIVDELKMR